MAAVGQTRRLVATEATPASFARYGQVIMPSDDGVAFGPDDARLGLNAGVPRFYVMRLEHRGLVFRHITRHRRVTQCLGSMMGTPWLLGVAAAGDGRETPDPDTIAAFLVPGDRIIKLDQGAWHAGPYFDAASALFLNLELADTNVTDHQSCDLAATYGLQFEMVHAATASSSTERVASA